MLPLNLDKLMMRRCCMNKKKYYVSVTSREISQIPFENNQDFVIYATDEEVRLLRAKMDNMYEEDMNSFWRAHIPIMSYHQNNPNNEYDSELMAAYEMIYHLGDEETKSNIHQ